MESLASSKANQRAIADYGQQGAKLIAEAEKDATGASAKELAQIKIDLKKANGEKNIAEAKAKGRDALIDAGARIRAQSAVNVEHRRLNIAALKRQGVEHPLYKTLMATDESDLKGLAKVLKQYHIYNGNDPTKIKENVHLVFKHVHPDDV